MIRKILWIGMAFGLFSCAIPTRQTDSYLKESHDIPDVVKIKDVPYIHQEKNLCGPASLAMVMAYQGKPVAVETLTTEAYTPGKSGSLQADLIGAVRRNGMMGVEVHGLPALLHEVNAGHPVIIFENLGLSWYSIWHYAVVYGYDISDPSHPYLTMHSGPSQDSLVSMRKFERAWMDSGYWGLVILPPGQLAVSGDDLGHTVAAAGLEQLGEVNEAQTAYESILTRWPKSLGSLIGMGNLRYASKDYLGSVHYLTEATLEYPSSSIAWHNLATAQSAANQKEKAHLSAVKAISLASPAEVPQYRESLKDSL